MDSFIDFCNRMTIATELFSRKKPSKIKADKTKDASPARFTLKKASGNAFEHLYKTEAFCAEGFRDPHKEENAQVIFEAISEWDGTPNTVRLYWCTGKDINQYYHLTGDNRYPDNLGIFFIDWSNFDRSFNASSYKGKFRYFSDVVDNNARREIRNNNPYYKNYHSLYGDDWFYGTV